MVDYIISNNSGIQIVIRVDAADHTDNFFTISQILGIDTPAEFLAFQALKVGTVIDKSLLIGIANANTLNMQAIHVGPPVPTTVVHIQQTVPTPGTFTATAITGTKMNLAWTLAGNGQQHHIDRATNVGFTTGVVLDIYNGNALAYQDKGLVAATTYYYRLRTTGNLYKDSNYATANAAAIA